VPCGLGLKSTTCCRKSICAANEIEERLEQRFRALPAEYQRVIGLRQFEGLSAREAAQRMGRSETAVHSLYRRALLAWQGDDSFGGMSDESESV